MRNVGQQTSKAQHQHQKKTPGDLSSNPHAVRDSFRATAAVPGTIAQASLLFSAPDSAHPKNTMVLLSVVVRVAVRVVVRVVGVVGAVGVVCVVRVGGCGAAGGAAGAGGAGGVGVGVDHAPLTCPKHTCLKHASGGWRTRRCQSWGRRKTKQFQSSK